MHSIRALALLAFAFAAAPAARALDAPDFSSPREKSMGGRHVALADDFSVLLTNPAGLASVPRRFSAGDLGIQLTGPIFDIVDLASTGMPSNSSITDFLASHDWKLNAGFDISGPIALGYTGGGLGFGLFNKTKLLVNVASMNSISVTASEDVMLSGGYAVRLDLGKGHALDAGVSAKGFVMGDIAKIMGIAEALELKNSPSSILSNNFILTTGIGLDAGLRWSWNGRLAAGLVYRDLFSPAISTTYSSFPDFISNPSGSKLGSASYESLKGKLDFGLAWTPALGRLGEVIDSLSLAMDYKDILGLLDPVPRNAILNLSLGVETKFLQIVTLRAGIADALPSAGGSLNLGAFTLSLAAFGTELGLDPGDRPCYNLLVDFDFKY
jgi:hypothetical protein